MFINYRQLVEKYNELKKYWKDDIYHFEDNRSVILLNKCILKEYFQISIPESLTTSDNLFPRVPGRLAYIEFIIQDIINPHEIISSSNYTILDIGTGAYSIYPILLSQTLLKSHIDGIVKIIGTDIDHESVENSKKLINYNTLNDSITIVETKKDRNLFSFLNNNKSDTIITICNPPFYASRKEFQELQDKKVDSKTLLPLSGTDNELITDGGELSFLIRMVNDSQMFSKFCRRKKLTWFTSLISRYSTLEPIITYLSKDIHIKDYFVKDIRIGNTTRWVLCWNFNNCKLKQIRISKNLQKLQSFQTVLHIPNAKLNKSILSINQLLLQRTCQKLATEVVDENHIIINTDIGDCWSRKYRRSRQEASNKVDRTPIIRHSFILERLNDTNAIFVWYYGDDYQLFQSLQGFINRLYLL